MQNIKTEPCLFTVQATESPCINKERENLNVDVDVAKKKGKTE